MPSFAAIEYMSPAMPELRPVASLEQLVALMLSERWPP
jgi:hypothetical protein